MKLNFSDIKSKLKLGKNGSPILAVILFVVAFSVTLWIFGGGLSKSVDNRELGRNMREAVESEPGEVIATINDIEYYERDLQIVKLSMFAEHTYYYNLKESQQRSLAGYQLVLQFMLINEFDRLGLSVTEDECDEYIEKERKSVLSHISDGDKDGTASLEYIEGYGCTFDSYWQDSAVRESYINSLKYNKAQEEIKRLIDAGSIDAADTDSYLRSLIKDGVYKVTLFGKDVEAGN